MGLREEADEIWWAYNTQVFISISLVSQILLAFFAPLRKTKKQKWFARFTWLVYFMADWVAHFALGLLFNAIFIYRYSYYMNPDILALWAPFLLLHLGGPDNITAFAVEDNELWFRHLFGLFFQIVPAVYIVWRISPPNILLAPIILIFIVGIIKYCERTWALYQASNDVLNESISQGHKPGQDYDRLVVEYMQTKEDQKPKEQNMDIAVEGFLDHLDHVKMVRFAYYLFHTFKGFLVDDLLNFHDLKSIQQFFC